MTAEDLRKSILQQAIQGKLVPQDPTDEPASVLLARIREEKARLVKEKKIKKDKNESLIYRGDDNSYYEKFADGTVKCIDEEIPFEIPQGWEWSRLSQTIELLSGRDLTQDQYNANGIGIPYMTGASNFENGELIINRWTSTPVAISHKGDLLITCKGTIGEMAINVIGDIHVARQIMAISTDCLEIEYVKIFMHTLVDNLNAKAKSIIPGISREHILNSLLPLPSLNEQKRIVRKVAAIYPLIANYDISYAKLEREENSIKMRLQQSILQYAIQGNLIPQNPEDEPAIELLKRIEEEKSRLVKAGKIKRDKNASVIFKGEDNKYYEKLGSKVSDITDDIPFDIPDSWQWCRLSTLVNLYTGNSINESDKKKYYTDVEGLEYIATKDLSFEGRFCYKNGVAIPESHLSEFRIAPKGAVLMCIEGGSAGRKVGQLEQDVCFGNKLCCFAPYADISEYILYYLQSPIFYDIFTSSKSGIIGGVSVNNLKQLLVPLPPYSEIRRIVPAIRKVLKSIEG